MHLNIHCKRHTAVTWVTDKAHGSLGDTWHNYSVAWVNLSCKGSSKKKLPSEFLLHKTSAFLLLREIRFGFCHEQRSTL